MREEMIKILEEVNKEEEDDAKQTAAFEDEDPDMEETEEGVVIPDKHLGGYDWSRQVNEVVNSVILFGMSHISWSIFKCEK